MAKVLEIDEYQNIYEHHMINNVSYRVLNTSHDAIDPIGIMFDNDEKIVHITDTGYVNHQIINQCQDAFCYVFESNYDDHMMIINDKYPLSVKQRIMSECGHLSNADSNKYLNKMIGDNTKWVMFAHLSENNNHHDIVASAHDNIMVENKIVLAKDDVIEVVF